MIPQKSFPKPIMKYLPLLPTFLLVLSLMTSACQDPGIEPVARICFEGRGIDLGPENHYGYNYALSRNNFGFPVAHPAEDDTLYYMRWIVDETGNPPLIEREIWWYSIRSGHATHITSDLLFTHAFDVNRKGEIAFLARQGLSIIRTDGTGQEVVYTGTANGIKWDGSGDTIYFITPSTDADMAYRENNTWKLKKRNPPLTYPYAFSPNGQKMAMVEYNGFPGVYQSLILVDSDGNLLRRYPGATVGNSDLELGPEGKWAYWSGTQGDTKYQLQRMNLRTEEIQTLRLYDATDSYSSFDVVNKGKQLVVNRLISDSLGNAQVLQRSELWIMDIGGCNERKLELPEG